MYLSKPKQQQEFSILFLLEFQIIIIMQLSTTKIRKHEITKQRISLLSKTLLYSLNKKQNKKIKTHNLIFL